MNEFFRECPKCGKNIFHKSKFLLDHGIKKNLNCKSCSLTGIKKSEEHKKNIRDFYKGKTYEEIHGKEKSDKMKKKLSESHMGKKSPMFGLHHTKESNLKNSNSHKGKIPSLETRKKNSESNLGKIPINKGLTNKELYGEDRAAEISKKISMSSQNPSDETRRRQRLAAINRINNQIKNGEN